jgi:predicted TIM-barrel fold metal-dependent hydrolase
MSQEEVIDPELEICDPHHHLWHMSDAAVQALGNVPITRYLLPDLLEDIGRGHNVTKTVFVEANAFYRAGVPELLAPIGETEFASGVAAMSASGRYGSSRICAGIVAKADLSIGAAIEEVLEAHVRVGGGRLRGIRLSGAVDPAGAVTWGNAKPQLYLDPRFREGLACLARFGLSFEAWCYHIGIGELTDLARAFPAQPIMLDHLGTPMRIGPYASHRDEIFVQWRAALRELATCPNVFIKLGGLGMYMLGFDLPAPSAVTSEQVADAWRPYLETAIDAFGEDRCLFESNYPVDAYLCDYLTLWNAFKRVAQGCTPEVKRRLFHDNAVGFYNL